MLIERIPWSEDAEAHMRNEAGRHCLPFLRAEVIRGRSKLWRCTDGPSLAHVVTRLDANPLELVIAYAEGRDMHKFAPWFIDSAHTRGIPLRIHTDSSAMARLLRQRWGLQLQEYVLRTAP